MPRNSSGTYTLPAGNPVVTGTTISSSWANTTLADLGTAMTDSLSRSGQGGMTAALSLADGAIGTPGLNWTNEATSGLYRAGAGDFRWAQGGADKFQIGATGLRLIDGSAPSPSLSFINDTDVGLYRIGANVLGLSVGGALHSSFTTSQLLLSISQISFNPTTPSQNFIQFGDSAGTNTAFFGWAGAGGNIVGGSARGDLVLRTNTGSNILFTIDAGANIFGRVNSVGQLAWQDGSVGTPAITFASDLDSGIYKVASNDVGITVGGVVQFAVSSARTFIGSTQLLGPDGNVGSPGHSFFNDSNTGVWRSGPDTLDFATGGTNRAQFTTTAFNSTLPWLGPDGGLGTPAVSFSADPDTGLYRVGTNQLAVVVGGASVFEATSVGVGGILIGAGLIAGTVPWQINSASAAGATAGGGAALPATVAGFLQWTINGTVRKIPYYAN